LESEFISGSKTQFSNGNSEVSLLNEWILYVVRSLVLSSTVLGAQRQAK